MFENQSIARVSAENFHNRSRLVDFLAITNDAFSKKLTYKKFFETSRIMMKKNGPNDRVGPKISRSSCCLETRFAFSFCIGFPRKILATEFQITGTT